MRPIRLMNPIVHWLNWVKTPTESIDFNWSSGTNGSDDSNGSVGANGSDDYNGPVGSNWATWPIIGTNIDALKLGDLEPYYDS